MFFNCQRRKKLKDKNKQGPGKQNADLGSCKMGQGSLPLRERNKLKNIWHSSIPLATPPENYNKD
jgi:hypothetical protein